MEPDMKTITCYQRSAKDEPATVQINMAYVVSCERAPQGGDLYYAILTMYTGQQYFISEADYHRLFPQ